jgi:hypothetical protein
VRARTCARLRLLGLPDALLPADGDAVIGPEQHQPAVVVVTAHEDIQMARETRKALAES